MKLALLALLSLFGLWSATAAPHFQKHRGLDLSAPRLTDPDAKLDSDEAASGEDYNEEGEDDGGGDGMDKAAAEAMPPAAPPAVKPRQRRGKEMVDCRDAKADGSCDLCVPPTAAPKKVVRDMNTYGKFETWKGRRPKKAIHCFFTNSSVPEKYSCGECEVNLGDRDHNYMCIMAPERCAKGEFGNPRWTCRHTMRAEKRCGQFPPLV